MRFSLRRLRGCPPAFFWAVGGGLRPRIEVEIPVWTNVGLLGVNLVFGALPLLAQWWPFQPETFLQMVKLLGAILRASRWIGDFGPGG